MSSKALFSGLIIGSGSIAVGGYGVYVAITPANPLKIAAKIVETAKLLKETFEELKKAKEEFLKIVEEQDDDQEEEEAVRDQEDEDGGQLSVKKTDEKKIQDLFKNIFLSKALENLLLQDLSEEIKTKMEEHKSKKVDQDFEASKKLLESGENLTKIINLAEKFAQQVISLYGELTSLFKDQEKLFGEIKLGKDDKNPLKNSAYSQSLMSIPEKIFTLEGDENSKKEGVGNSQEGEGVNNESQDKIEDNIFGLKISGTPVLDSKEFAETLKKDGIFEVTTEKDDDSQNIKTLTLKLKKSTEEKPETMWTYFGFTNQDLNSWKEIVNYKGSQQAPKIPVAK